MVALQLLEGGMDFVVIAQSNVLRLYPCTQAPCRLVKFVLVAVSCAMDKYPTYGKPAMEFQL